MHNATESNNRVYNDMCVQQDVLCYRGWFAPEFCQVRFSSYLRVHFFFLFFWSDQNTPDCPITSIARYTSGSYLSGIRSGSNQKYTDGWKNVKNRTMRACTAQVVNWVIYFYAYSDRLIFLSVFIFYTPCPKNEHILMRRNNNNNNNQLKGY